jgi:hypothetical protein
MPALSLALLGRGTSANDGTGDTARDGALKLNRNARLLEALAKGAVISATTTAQPVSPTVGDLYIIPSGKTGTDWSTMTNGSLALYAENDGANAWFEITPAEGWRMWVKDTDVLYRHNGSRWATEFPDIAAGTIFVFEGDSKSTTTSPVSTPIQTYFAAFPSASALTFQNKASNGAKLSDLVSEYAAQVQIYAPGESSNTANAPAILSVWIGANDVWQLVSLGYTDAADYFADLEAYWSQAVADGFRVVAWTIEARGDKQDATTEAFRREINRRIRASTIPTWIVDPEAVSIDYANTLWWDADTIHHTAAGNQRLAKLLVSVLNGGAPGLPSLPPAINYARQKRLDTFAASGFKAVKSANQTGIGDSSFTKVTFDTVVFNDDGTFASNKWTPPAGRVRMTAQVKITGTFSAAALVFAVLYKNGVPASNSAPIYAPVANDQEVLIEYVDVADGTDYYEVYVYADVSSGTATVTAGTSPYYRTSFQGWVLP